MLQKDDYQKAVQEKELPEYGEDGVDLTLIRWMLSLTVTERLKTLQQTVCSLERLRRAKSLH